MLVFVFNLRAWLHHPARGDLLLLRTYHAEGEAHGKTGEALRVERHQRQPDVARVYGHSDTALCQIWHEKGTLVNRENMAFGGDREVNQW